MLSDKATYKDTIILGAGLAGLSASYHGGGIIYEKEKEIGGTCRSLKGGGFIFDQGIHVLHTKNSYVLSLLSKHKNLRLKQKMRSAWIHSYGVLTKYPFQANTYGLPRHIIKECLEGFIKTLSRPKQTYSNYDDWIYGTFGRGIANNFYLPYSEKFWTVKAKELTVDWLDIRVPRPHLEQVIQGAESIQKEEFGPNAVFQYPQCGGIQRIIEAVINRNVKVMVCKAANRIDIKKKIIHFNDGTAIHFKKLISTIPLPELFKIINIVPEPVIQAVNDLRHNSVLCINLGIRRENISFTHWIYFPEEKYAAFRISFPGNFSRFTVPKKWSSIQAEISYSDNKPLRYKDITEKVIQDLIKARIIKPKDYIKLINVQDIKYAYVIYDHNRLSNLKLINRFLKKNDIHSSGRYGEWKYLWMDEAILSGQEVAKEIKIQSK